jgi:hypothetical protein
MNKREWLYYLLTTDGQSYYIKNGVLHVSSTPHPVAYGPDGWKDISIGYERSLTDWGNVINFSLPLKFVLDGAEILRTLLDTFNIETVVKLLIQRQSLFINDTNYYYYYKFFYKGEIDLSTYEDTETDFTVNIMQGDISKSIKAFKTTAYQIAPDDVVVKMDGPVLTGRKRFVVINPSYAHGIYSVGTDIKEQMVMQSANSEGVFINTFFKDFVGDPIDANEGYINGEDLSTSEKYNGLVMADVTFKQITFTGSITKFQVGPSFGSRVGLDFFLETGAGVTTFLFNISIDGYSPSNPTQNFSAVSNPISLLPGDTWFVWHRPTAFQSNNAWKFEDNCVFEYKTLDRVAPTYIKAELPFNLFSQLVDKTTSTTGKAVSALLQSKNNLVVTTGDTVRGLADTKIKTSLAKFTEAFNVILNTGVGVIQEKYYLEKKEFFLRDENVIPLGAVKAYKRSLPTDIMGNVLKLGYQPKDSDDVNGRYSFNNTNVYTSPITKVVKEIPLVTDYITDPYVIEIYRANMEGKTTTDSDKDSAIIVLNIDYDNPQTLTADEGGYPAGTIYYNLKRVTYDSITGVEDSTGLYNIEELTPNRLLDVHANYLNSIFYGFAGQKLTFQTASKNEDLRTQLGSIVYTENADFLLKNTPMLFKPIKFEVIPEPTDELVDVLTDNPNRCFSFIHPNGNTYRGFNLKIGVAPNTEQEQAFELLAVWDQDLTTLKNR